MVIKLEETLIDEGILTEQDIISLKSKQKEENTTFTEQLIVSGKINKKNMIKLLESKFNITFFDLETRDINYEAAFLVPKELAEKFCVFPVDLVDSTIYVSMADPFDLEAMESIKFAAGKDVYAYFSDKDQINICIDKFYTRQSTEKVLEKFRNTDVSLKTFESGTLQDAPAVSILDYVLDQAILVNASDIHIEAFESNSLVRLRRDGKLSELIRIPNNLYTLVIAKIKLIGNLETSEKRVPQDGKFQKTIKGETYDFRVSIIPTVFGEKTVIRVLYKNGIDMNFNSLGFNDANIKVIEKILLHSSGLVLITGPTGSGKSTTLYSMLNYLNKSDINIVTIEDPVEYFLLGVNQINVNPKIGLSFARGLRSILRQDPDIIMVGEIRDAETAEMAARASITGHLVLSTLHTKDAVGSIIRLRDMGVQNYLLSDALVAVIAQRLVRKICPFCKREYILSQKEKEQFKLEYKVFIGKGCTKCSYTGYLGRRAIYEILYLEDGQRRLIATNMESDEIRKHNYSTGTVSLKSECLNLLKSGVISLKEYTKFINDF